MGQPTESDVHVNVPLTNLSIAYMQESRPVSDVVFPTVAVAKQSDKYYIYDPEPWFRSDVQQRAPGTESAGSGWTLSTDTYYCDPYALHKDITVEERDNADSVLELDTDSVMYLTMQMKLKREIVWAAEYFTTSIWTGSSTGGDITPATLWDAANSTPIADMRTEIRSVHTKTGFKPNTLVLAADVWDALQDNADFLDRIKYTQTGIVTLDLLARVLDIGRVVLAEMVQVTTNEGDATPTYAQIFTGKALLAYVAARPGKRIPSAGYRFAWKRDTDSGMAVRKFEMRHLRSDRLEIQEYYDNKLVNAALGAFFTGTIS